MDIVVTRDQKEAYYAGGIGSPYLRRYHHLVKGHDYAAAVNRETGSDRYFVFFSESTQSYVLGYWLDGPYWYKDEVGRYSGITSWSDAPQELSKTLAQINQGRGRAKRLQEAMNDYFIEKEEIEMQRYQAVQEMGKFYAKKAATLGVRHDPVYEQWKRGEGLSVPITDAEKEQHEMMADAYMPSKIMGTKP